MNKWMIMLTLVFLMLFGVRLAQGNTNKIIDVYYKSVYIKQGDTLWDIALEYKPKNENTKSFVIEIMRLNNIQSTKIKYGESLFVPIQR